jgi:cytochrome c oxidase subunit I+III
VVPAFAFGVLAVVCIVRWLWQTDRLPGGTQGAQAGAQVADGVRLPVGARLLASHSWWATIVLLVVDFTVLASMAFGHTHLAMLLDVCPPPGAALPPFADVMLAAGGFLLGGALLAPGARRLSTRALGRAHLLPLMASLAVTVASFVGLLGAFVDAGLAPTAHGWAATIASLLSYLGFHIAVVGIAAVYLAARLWRGLVTPRQSATFDNIALLWWGTCAQGVIVALLPHAVAAAMP